MANAKAGVYWSPLIPVPHVQKPPPSRRDKKTITYRSIA
jgi:hypothetical protein